MLLPDAVIKFENRDKWILTIKRRSLQISEEKPRMDKEKSQMEKEQHNLDTEVIKITLAIKNSDAINLLKFTLYEF